MKTCTKCLETKDFSFFYKQKKGKYGLSSWCKNCFKSYETANREKQLERTNKYKKANPEKIAAYQKKWNLDNKKYKTTAENKRKAKKRNNGVFEIRPKFIKKLYNSPCFYCGSKKNIQQDHVLPINKGGPHKEGNLVPACRTCNISKHDKLLIVWKMQKQKQINANVLVGN